MLCGRESTSLERRNRHGNLAELHRYVRAQGRSGSKARACEGGTQLAIHPKREVQGFKNANGGAPFLKSSLPLLLWSQRRKPPRPPRGKLYRRFFAFPSFFGVHSLLGAGFFFCSVPASAGFPALQDSSLSNIPGRTSRRPPPGARGGDNGCIFLFW